MTDEREQADENTEPGGPSGRGRKMARAIGRAERLEKKATTARGRNLWVQVSRVGTLGWLLALPIIGGALLGHLVDRSQGTGVTFALAFLTVGLILAGYTLWRQADELSHD